MSRAPRNKIRPPKPSLTVSPSTSSGNDDQYPETRAMTSGVVAAVAKIDIRKTLSDSIRDGLMPVDIPTEQIDAIAVDSDRQSGWEKDDDFALLMNNIKERGQIQPIVVRPAETDWKPSENTPMTMREGDRFILLSGRRRFMVCSQLGIPVRAIIRDRKDELDIEERFFENTIRRGLTQLEYHISVAQISEARELSQSELSRKLGVPQPTISKSLKVLRNLHALLERYPDANSLTRADLYDAVDMIEHGTQNSDPGDHGEQRSGAVGRPSEQSEQVTPSTPTPSPQIKTSPTEAQVSGGLEKLKVRRDGVSGTLTRKFNRSQLRLTLDLPSDFSEDDLSELADKIEALIS
ncbi:ParB/RepB/Spo0J family partition protein [Sulfitobacter sp. R18_1]|uniref:ParB/RepB/Spo0J family partition protein n=1 Tax=Sulfitobacter sp. R18_1 TaxID=2821104 RepID=UPI001AD9A3C3|nr:ParB/RepB/Spo0J family partition protein [Sulfitobacter sp. R18_1]MBO9428424.1 ParB/RepB/Spo0J family partition protein [Sulfitobacter sp. R18_1]